MAIRIRNVSPFAHIIDLIPKNFINDLESDVVIINRDRDNSLLLFESKRCYMVENEEQTHELFGTRKFRKYEAVGINATQNGDCGSPYVALTNAGPSLICLHQSKRGDSLVSGVALKRDIVENLVCAFEPQIQGGSILRETCGFILQKWSPDPNIRRIPNAHCVVFGTSQRRFPAKSNVRRSMLFDSCIEKGFKDNFGPPVMRHRDVWIKQATPMLQRVCMEDHDLLDSAIAMFTR